MCTKNIIARGRSNTVGTNHSGASKRGAINAGTVAKYMFKETLTNAAPHAKSVIDAKGRSRSRTHSKTMCVCAILTIIQRHRTIYMLARNLKKNQRPYV